MEEQRQAPGMEESTRPYPETFIYRRCSNPDDFKLPFWDSLRSTGR